MSLHPKCALAVAFFCCCHRQSFHDWRFKHGRQHSLARRSSADCCVGRSASRPTFLSHPLAMARDRDFRCPVENRSHWRSPLFLSRRLQRIRAGRYRTVGPFLNSRLESFTIHQRKNHAGRTSADVVQRSNYLCLILQVFRLHHQLKPRRTTS